MIHLLLEDDLLQFEKRFQRMKNWHCHLTLRKLFRVFRELPFPLQEGVVGVCSIYWILYQFMCALIDVLIALQFQLSHLLDTKQPKFSKSNTLQTLCPESHYMSMLTQEHKNTLTHFWLNTLQNNIDKYQGIQNFTSVSLHTTQDVCFVYYTN